MYHMKTVHNKSIVGVTKTPPTNHSFGMTTTKILKDMFLRHIPSMARLYMKLVLISDLQTPDPSCT